jgi:hypothetical protein
VDRLAHQNWKNYWRLCRRSNCPRCPVTRAEDIPGDEFYETLELLRRSMGRSIADYYWERMLNSKPHPNDVQEGEQ